MKQKQVLSGDFKEAEGKRERKKFIKKENMNFAKVLRESLHTSQLSKYESVLSSQERISGQPVCGHHVPRGKKLVPPHKGYITRGICVLTSSVVS